MNIDRLLGEMKELHREIFGVPAPDLSAESLVPLPPGCDPVQVVATQLEQLREIHRQMTAVQRAPQWLPTADCFVTPEAFVVQLDAPGIPRDDIEVTIADGHCVIRGERKRPSEELQPISVERLAGRFERRFPLPPGTPDEDVKAQYRDGVLEVRFPREVTTAGERPTHTVAVN